MDSLHSNSIRTGTILKMPNIQSPIGLSNHGLETDFIEVEEHLPFRVRIKNTNCCRGLPPSIQAKLRTVLMSVYQVLE